ncbi:hypothetical protein BDY24DRAFT_416475 [Mrakia frigida]|uniref:uncharacterized protein n=1 Tax=Mrakia frigida TaxID=29902 RepID=UPI003FCC06E5
MSRALARDFKGKGRSGVTVRVEESQNSDRGTTPEETPASPDGASSSPDAFTDPTALSRPRLDYRVPGSSNRIPRAPSQTQGASTPSNIPASIPSSQPTPSQKPRIAPAPANRPVATPAKPTKGKAGAAKKK